MGRSCTWWSATWARAWRGWSRWAASWCSPRRTSGSMAISPRCGIPRATWWGCISRGESVPTHHDRLPDRRVDLISAALAWRVGRIGARGDVTTDADALRGAIVAQAVGDHALVVLGRRVVERQA